MKESIYNYHFIINDKEYIFNTNNNGLIERTSETFNEEEQRYLIENNFWVADDLDEADELEREINRNIQSGTDNLTLTIELTNQCNFKCIYCSQEKNEKMMTKETADAILQKAKELLAVHKFPSIRIHYFGGEPLMNIPLLLYFDEQFREICAAYKAAYIPTITTNGSLLTDELLEKIGFHTIQLTLEGMEQTHNHLRVSDSFHFQEELDLIERILQKSQSKIIFRMNICKQNKNEAVELHQMILGKFGHERFEISPNIMLKFHENDPVDALSPKEFADTLFQIRLLMDELTGNFTLPMPKPLPCNFLYGNAYAISPDGYCDFCSSYTQNGKTKFTDVDITAKQKLTFRPECRNCKCLPLCLGGCVVQYQLNNEYCIPEKYHMQEIIAHYVAKLQSA